MPAAGSLHAPDQVDSLSRRSAGRRQSPADRLERSYPLVVVVGPTASGKSALALALARKLDGEILSCDSVQVYRRFDVGSGKVPVEDRRGIAHHLLDIAEPDQVFTAGDYRREALRVVASVREREKLPIIVGGTGLYLRALLVGLFEGPPRSEELRARLRSIAARHGTEFLHRMLTRMDAATAMRIHPRDVQKVIRALEIGLLARQPVSVMFARGRVGLQGFRLFKIGLNPERQDLRERINHRVEHMFASGLLDETRAALAGPNTARLKPLHSLGYIQACSLVRNETSKEDAIRETQVATRQYAKRQLTWFRREPEVTWFAGFGDDPRVQRRVLNWVQAALRGGSASLPATKSVATIS